MKINLSFEGDNSQIKRDIDSIIEKMKDIEKSKEEISKPLIDDKSIDKTKSSLDEMAESAKDLGERLADVEREMRKVTNHAKAIAEQSKMRDELISKLDKENEKLKSLERQYDELSRKQSKGVADRKAMFDIEKEIDKVTGSMKTLDEQFLQVDKRIQDYARRMVGASKLGVKEFEKFSQSVKGAKNEADVLNAAVETLGKGGSRNIDLVAKAMEKAQVDSKRVSQVIRDIRNELTRMKLSGEDATNPERYQELTKRARDYQTALKEIDNSLKGQSSQLNRVILGMQEISSVASVVTGTMALFGLENDNVVRTLTRLNALMTIMNGLQGVSTALTRQDSVVRSAWNAIMRASAVATNTTVTALTRLRLALISTGVGALVAGVGYLISKLVEWNSNNKEVEATTMRVNAQVGKEIVEVQKLRNTIENNNKSLEDRNRALGELRKMYPDILKNLTDEEILAGNVADAYKRIEQSIIDVNIAQAFRAKAEERINDYVQKYMEYYEQHVNNGKLFESTVTSILSMSKEELELEKQKTSEAIEQLRMNGLNAESLIYQYDLIDATLKIDSERGVVMNEVNKLLGESNKLTANITTNTQKIFTNTKNAKDNFKDLLNTLIQIEEKALMESLGAGLEKELKLLNKEFDNQIRTLDTLAKSFKDAGKMTEELEERFKNVAKTIVSNFQKDTFEAIENFNNSVVDLVQGIDKQLAREDEVQDVIDKYSNMYAEIDAKLAEIDANRHLVKGEQLEELNRLEEELINQRIALSKKEAKEVEDASVNSFINAQRRIKSITDNQLSLAKQIFGDSEEIKQAEIKSSYAYIEAFGISKEKVDAYLKSGGSVDIKAFFGLDNDNIAEEVGNEIANIVMVSSRKVQEMQGIFEKAGGSIGALFVLGFSGEVDKELEEALKRAGQQIERLARQTIDNIFEMQRTALQAQMSAQERNIENLRRLIEEERALLDERDTMYDEDMASSFERDEEKLNLLKEQLLAEEQAREETAQRLTELEIREAKARFAMQSAEQIMNSATALSAILKGSAQAMASTASIPFVGVALGIAQAVALVSGYLAMRAKINAMKQDVPTFETGGALDLKNVGHSHRQGGLGLHTKDGRKVAEYERGEILYAVNKKESRRGHVLPLLEMLNLGDLQGMELMLSDINGTINQSEVRVKNDINVKTDKEVSKGLNRLIAISNKNIYYHNGSKYIKKGNKITRVI